MQINSNQKHLIYLLKLIAIVTSILLLAFFFGLGFFHSNPDKASDRFLTFFEQVIIELFSILLVFIVINEVLSKKNLSPSSLLVDEISSKITDKYNLKSILSPDKAKEVFNDKEQLSNAKSIEILGYSAVNLISIHVNEIAESLQNGGKLKLIIIKPDSIAFNLVMENSSSKILKSDIERTIIKLETIKKISKQDIANSSIEVKYMDWIPSFSVVIINRHHKNACLKATVNQIHTKEANPSIKELNFVVQKDNHSTSLFEYFLNQFDEKWNSVV